MKFLKVEQLTNEKYLNLFVLYYEHDGKQIVWTMASRKSKADLSDYLNRTANDRAPDTVCVVPLFNDKDGDDCIMMTKEFRQPTNSFVISFPAGLVEDGEGAEESALRELREEIGATCISSLVSFPVRNTLNSEGMTDENVTMFIAEVEEFDSQNLQDCEIIELVPVKMKSIETFIKNEEENGSQFSTKAGIFLSTYLMLKNHKLEL